ncbi:MAG: hypothetical protein M3P04_04200, partial [Actinomycetota bacterium]|nr:hypothetical protein [Actinomycetota bacterium]
LVAGSVVWLGPDVLARLSPDVDQGSVDVRIHRLPHVLEIAAAHPFRGTGFTGIQVFGTGLVDSSYLQVYVEAGVVAALLLVIALLAPVVVTLRGVLVGRAGDDWLLAVGAVGGMAALGVGAAFFDAFTTLSSARLFWLLAGAGLVAAERCAGPVRRPAWRDLLHPGRLALVVLAVAAGFGVRAVWPTHATVISLYSTTDVRTAFTVQPPGLSRTLDTTLCQAAREGVDPVFDWHVSTCEELKVPGWVQVALTADDVPQAKAALGELTGRLKAYPGLAGLSEHPTAAGAVSGVPTIARTAPVSLGLLAGGVLLLVPARRRRALG